MVCELKRKYNCGFYYSESHDCNSDDFGDWYNCGRYKQYINHGEKLVLNSESRFSVRSSLDALLEKISNFF